VAVLRELGALLLEVHGQHETVGLLDPRTHRGLLDAFAAAQPLLEATAEAWTAMRAARERVEALADSAARAAADVELLTARLAELDRLDPREGEEAELAEERALLGAAEKALADIAAARDAVGEGAGGGLAVRLASALRAMERSRERAVSAGVAADSPAAERLTAAAEALERALVEVDEAAGAIDRAAESFEFEPDRLEEAETRLFGLRAAARKLGVAVDDLPRIGWRPPRPCGRWSPPTRRCARRRSKPRRLRRPMRPRLRVCPKPGGKAAIGCPPRRTRAEAPEAGARALQRRGRARAGARRSRRAPTA
jgi:DNA repair protein RecN (Recombination protein N)